jgi:hypothetical protein
MNTRKPKPDCPNCAGKGEIQTRITNGEWVTDTEPGPCRLCFGMPDDYRKEAEEMLERYSGKRSKEMDPEIQGEIWAGEEGDRFRRIMKFIWANPESSGSKNGMTKDSKPTTPFAKLFRFEEKISSKKRHFLAPDTIPTPVIPIFGAETNELRKAWGEAIKGIEKSSIPVLSYVRLTVSTNSLELAATDLDKWVKVSCPADGYVTGEYLLPGKLVYKILQTCDRKKVLAVGLPVAPSKDGKILLGNDTAVWSVYSLEPENFPSERRISNE